MPQPGFDWTADRTETLRRMWCEGASAAVIAAKLGAVSRNAVMGKVNRLGLTGVSRGASPAPAPSEAAPPPPPRSIFDLVSRALSEPAPAPVPQAGTASAAGARAALEQSPPAAGAAKGVSGKKAGHAASTGSAGPGRPGGTRGGGKRLAEPPAAPEPAADPLRLFSWEKPRQDGKPTIVGLRAESCRWPFGDPGASDFHFCGSEAAVGRPYCTEHCEAAYQKPDPNRPRKNVQWSFERTQKARQATLARIRDRARAPRFRAGA